MRLRPTIFLALCLLSGSAQAAPGVIATLGPRSSHPETIRGMIREGMTVARINLSHGGVRETRQKVAALSAASKAEGKSIPLLFDLPGGKVRTGALPKGTQPVRIADGAPYTLTFGPGKARTTTATTAFVDHPGLGRHAVLGDRLLLDDGKVELAVTAIHGDSVDTKVVRGGELRGKTGLAIADKELPFPSLTAQDRRKLLHAVEGGATYVAASMVQSPKNVRALKAALVRMGRPDIKVVAKIETWSGVEALDAILAESDAVMIARGDLSVAVGKDLPRVQALIAERCRKAGKPFIAATNFLSGMIAGEAPTEANKVDVARALRQGPQWFMLNETAISPRPVEIVKTLRTLTR